MKKFFSLLLISFMGLFAFADYIDENHYLRYGNSYDLKKHWVETIRIGLDKSIIEIDGENREILTTIYNVLEYTGPRHEKEKSMFRKSVVKVYDFNEVSVILQTSSTIYKADGSIEYKTVDDFDIKYLYGENKKYSDKTNRYYNLWFLPNCLNDDYKYKEDYVAPEEVFLIYYS